MREVLRDLCQRPSVGDEHPGGHELQELPVAVDRLLTLPLGTAYNSALCVVADHTHGGLGGCVGETASGQNLPRQAGEFTHITGPALKFRKIVRYLLHDIHKCNRHLIMSRWVARELSCSLGCRHFAVTYFLVRPRRRLSSPQPQAADTGRAQPKQRFFD
jgi:hypothetical protein